MPITLPANQCPAIQVPAAFLRIADASTSANGNAPVSENMTVGTGANFRYDTIRPHATRIDLMGRYGGGGYAIATGLAISADTGLLLAITAGHALLDGIVEVPASTTLAIPDAQPRVWIWLRQSGALAYTVTTVPPSGAACMLGSCVTSGGAITAVDGSGALSLRSGALFRQSADAGIPTDSPPVTTLFVHATPFCDWLWDGTAYRQLWIPEVTADPTSLANGMTWFRSDTLQLSRYTGGAVKRGAAMA